MSVQEILEIKKSLASAVAGSRADDTVRLLLKLRQQVQPTEELLKETKIGLSVGKLRQNPSKQVAELAKDIVKKWKNDVGSGKSAGKSESKAALDSVAPSPTPAPSGSRSPLVTPASGKSESNGESASKIPTPVRKPSISGGKPRTSTSDSITFDLHKDPTRDKCMQLIYDALCFDSEAPSDLIFSRAKEIEATVYKDSGLDTSPAYRTKMRSLYMNLKDKNNPGLRDEVVTGTVAASKLCSMSAADMASEERKAHDRKLLEANLFAARGAGSAASETDSFKCSRCGQRKCTYYREFPLGHCPTSGQHLCDRDADEKRGRTDDDLRHLHSLQQSVEVLLNRHLSSQRMYDTIMISLTYADDRCFMKFTGLNQAKVWELTLAKSCFV